MNTRRCPSVLNTKEKSTRFAGASNNLSLSFRDLRGLLSHVFAVFDVVCVGNAKENFITKRASQYF